MEIQESRYSINTSDRSKKLAHQLIQISGFIIISQGKLLLWWTSSLQPLSLSFALIATRILTEHRPSLGVINWHGGGQLTGPILQSRRGAYESDRKEYFARKHPEWSNPVSQLWFGIVRETNTNNLSYMYRYKNCPVLTRRETGCLAEGRRPRPS